MCVAGARGAAGGGAVLTGELKPLLSVIRLSSAGRACWPPLLGTRRKGQHGPRLSSWTGGHSPHRALCWPEGLQPHGRRDLAEQGLRKPVSPEPPPNLPPDQEPSFLIHVPSFPWSQLLCGYFIPTFPLQTPRTAPSGPVSAPGHCSPAPLTHWTLSVSTTELPGGPTLADPDSLGLPSPSHSPHPGGGTSCAGKSGACDPKALNLHPCPVQVRRAPTASSCSDSHGPQGTSTLWETPVSRGSLSGQWWQGEAGPHPSLKTHPGPGRLLTGMHTPSLLGFSTVDKGRVDSRRPRGTGN